MSYFTFSPVGFWQFLQEAQEEQVELFFFPEGFLSDFVETAEQQFLPAMFEKDLQLAQVSEVFGVA